MIYVIEHLPTSYYIKSYLNIELVSASYTLNDHSKFMIDEHSWSDFMTVSCCRYPIPNINRLTFHNDKWYLSNSMYNMDDTKVFDNLIKSYKRESKLNSLLNKN